MNVSAASGVERVVAPDELLFSATDRRGIIRSANAAFVRLSRFSAEELSGAPHSLVRHPDMPGGVYRLMWDRLLADRPTGGFMQDRGKDGSHYWVFAAVTPLGDGFLSVRMAPRSPLFEAARQLYPRARAAEREALEHQGADRSAAAGIGARIIEDGLRPLGFETYDAFIIEALPAEIASRSRLVTASYARPWLRGPVGEVLDGARALDALLAGHVERLDADRTLSERLLAAATTVLDVARRLDRSVGAAQRASGEVAQTAPVLLNVATVMARPMHVTVTALERLAPQLRQLRSQVVALRFRIALAGLHNDMVAAFAAEVADGAAPPSAMHQVLLLGDAVHEGLAELAQTAHEVTRELSDVAHLVTEASERLDEFRRFLGQWRILVMRERSVVTLGDLLRPIDEEIDAGHQGIQLLRGLGDQCRSGQVPMDAAALQAQVARIRHAAASA